MGVFIWQGCQVQRGLCTLQCSHLWGVGEARTVWSSGDGTCSCQAGPPAACNGAAWDALSKELCLEHVSLDHGYKDMKASQQDPVRFCFRCKAVSQSSAKKHELQPVPAWCL